MARRNVDFMWQERASCGEALIKEKGEQVAMATMEGGLERTESEGRMTPLDLWLEFRKAWPKAVAGEQRRASKCAYCV